MVSGNNISARWGVWGASLPGVMLCLATVAGPAFAGDAAASGWGHWGGDAGGSRYTTLSQITPENVQQLEVAWTYQTGDVSPGTDKHGPTAFQASPLVIGERMYLCTPFNRIIALNAETGEELWVHDPQVDLTGVYTPVCRGVSYWEDQSQQTGETNASCSKRILSGTLDARLIAVDAETGKACKDFGDEGAVDLTANLGDVRKAEYYMTGTPLIAGDVAVTGAFVQDGQRTDAPGGVIRAFDIRTGELRWAFDPVPPGTTAVTAEAAAEGAIFTRGTPNVWGEMSYDAERKLVFLPTGNPQVDHFDGGTRHQKDYYGTSVVALDALTGEPQWNFQTVHHDLWDYDIASQPVLFNKGGKAALVQPTKMGHLFVLDRETGESLFPVEERPVPQTTVEGEYTSPTQPFPVLPEPLQPHTLTADDIWGMTPFDRNACREIFEGMRYDGIFTPPGLETTLAYPGLGGGVNWGSVSVNLETGVALANSMRVPYTMKLVPREQMQGKADGSDLVGMNPQEGTDYVVVRGAYLSPWGTPCVPTPWGSLRAIDLNTGKTLWEKPLGTLRNLAPFGVGDWFEWGGPNTGGSMQTASGLGFIAATMDGYLRAFAMQNGEELWRYALPAPAQATPISYSAGKDGRQFVAIAAGGHGPLAYAVAGTDSEKLQSLIGDTVVVFALPKTQ